MGVEDREDITRIFSGGRWPPFHGDESTINRLKAQFFDGGIHPQVPDSKALAPEVNQILQAVCSYYRIDESELLKSRRGRFNEPRAVAIYLVRMMRKDSFIDIGSTFGLRGYSSVGTVLESIRKRLTSDSELSERCHHIMKNVSISHQET
jgi:chromosomal replication initiation ATPase DnaA